VDGAGVHGRVGVDVALQGDAGRLDDDQRIETTEPDDRRVCDQHTAYTANTANSI